MSPDDAGANADAQGSGPSLSAQSTLTPTATPSIATPSTATSSVAAPSPATATAQNHTQRLPVNPRRHKVAAEHRKRVATACNACNIRRIKCSGEVPCRQCRSSSRDCVYPVPVEKVSIPRTELDDLKRKVELYEKTLRDAVPNALLDAIPNATRRHELQQLLGQTTTNTGTSTASASPSVMSSTTTQQAQPSQTSTKESCKEIRHSFTAPLNHHTLPHHYAQFRHETYSARPRDPSQGHPRFHHLHQHSSHSNPLEKRQDNEEYISTEGRLLHDPDGHARFLGETSGATFLDCLKEFMTTVLPLAYQNLRPGSDGSAFLSSLGSYQTYDSRPLHDRDVDPFWLPSRPGMVDMLSELRFFIQDGNGHWPSGGIYWWGNLLSSPELPPLGQESISARFDKCRHIAFHHTAFAIVSQATATPSRLTTGPNVSEFYFSRARLLLGNPLDITRFTINEVATLTLMGFYLVEMNRRDAAYMCVSNAMHISVMHGTHRGWVDESAKRVFWTLYILDRYLSCLMGRPPTIMDDAIRLPLPCDSLSLPPSDGLRAHVELARISGHIVCNTYCVSPSGNKTAPDRHLDEAIAMLDRWKVELAPRLHLSGNGLSDDPACCLLHMAHNQLVILAIRPVFFAAVKKTFAERCVTRQSSLSTHPQLTHLRRCVRAAEENIRLARQILILNHPRKLLQAGLHHIFNAAICLLLQELIYNENSPPRDAQARGQDLDFVIARFEDESRIGSNYGRDCATVLRDLRVLIQRLSTSVDSVQDASRGASLPHQTTMYDPIGSRATVEASPWSQKVTSELLQQPILVEQGHVLYDELMSWIDDDWQAYGGYLI